MISPAASAGQNCLPPLSSQCPGCQSEGFANERNDKTPACPEEMPSSGDRKDCRCSGCFCSNTRARGTQSAEARGYPISHENIGSGIDCGGEKGKVPGNGPSANISLPPSRRRVAAEGRQVVPVPACSRSVCRACYGEIAEIVAVTHGRYNHYSQGQGGSILLKRIWRVMGEIVEDMLVRKRSCILYNFFHVSIKVRNFLGYQGSRTLYKPQFALLPDFTQKFHLRNVLVMHDVHYHETVPAYISYQTIASIIGTDRSTVEMGIQDSVREIGKYLHRNPTQTLTIDIGVANLEFCGREYRIKWCPEFLQRFQNAVGPHILVSPYDPPTLTKGPPSGPFAPCRFDRECQNIPVLHSQVDACLDAESRITSVMMHDGRGGCGYRKTTW